MKILIIDDYKSHGESLVELVHALGHEAQYAADLAEAEWLLDLLSFDVALLDFDMPKMSGPAIADQLVLRYPKVRPVIMSAARLNAERRRRIGDLRFLAKPLTRHTLESLFAEFQRELAGSQLMRRAPMAIRPVEHGELMLLPRDDDESDGGRDASEAEDGRAGD